MTQPGSLHINAKFHWLTFMLSAFSPKAVINGQLVGLRWGDNVFPAPRGSHSIEMYIPYLWKFGRASIVVDNSTAVPPVFYAAPVWTWMRGAIGLQPQRYPGMTGAIVFYSIFVLALLACCGIAILSGNGS